MIVDQKVVSNFKNIILIWANDWIHMSEDKNLIIVGTASELL